MKKFISGIILGVLICSVLPIKAAIDEYILYKADYRLFINSYMYKDADLPLLNYKGNTYAPVRSVFEAAGMKLEWNADLGQGFVTTNTSQTSTQTSTSEATPTPTPGTTPTETNPVTTTENPTPTPTIDNSAAYQSEYNALTSAYNSTVQGYRDELKWYYDEYKKWADAYGSTDAVQQKLNIYKEKETYYNALISQATAKYNSDVAALKSKYGM